MALAALCLLGLFSTEIADTDFWWHLRTGEHIVHQRSFPVPDPFSYTADLGAPAYRGEPRVRYFNLTHEWLAQAVWYLIYRTAGFPGVVLFKALLLSGFCALAGVVAARRAAPQNASGLPPAAQVPYWGLGAAAATATVASWFSADRPALITFFLVAVFIWILERGGPLWILPALSVVWANSHGGFFLGWVILVAFAAAATVDRRLGRPAPETRRLWLVSLLSIALSGLNPNYFRIFEILPAYRQSYLMQSLVEWARPHLWGPPYAFNILLYVSAVVILQSRRRVRTADWFLFVPLAAASLLAFRNIMLTAFLAPILIASYFPWRRKLPALAAPALALVLAAGLGAGIYRGQFFQLRAAVWKFPSGAADWLLAHRISKPIFNTYEYGGYLIWRLWPHYRVFIDGRALNESVYRDYVRVLGNSGANEAESRHARREVLSRYGVGAIVANAFEYTTGVLYPMIQALADPADPEWQLVYQDPQAMIFMRDPPPDVPPLSKAVIQDHLEAECRTYVERDPELSLCARTLGFHFLRSGDNARALRSLSLYLASPHEPDLEAENAYQRLLRR